jgi:hypothetical protein
MGKNLVLVAGLISSLTLSARGTEQAKVERGMCPAELSVQFRVMKEGKLVYLDPIRPKIPEASEWDGYGMEVGGKFFGLDLGSDKELGQRVGKLLGKKVRVTGTVEQRTLPGWTKHWDRRIDVLVVTEIESAENVQKTIHVKMKGKLKCLHVTYDLITGTLNSVHDNWDAPQSRCEVKVPGLEVNGKLYGLTDVRPTSADDAKQFERLCGRMVIVTGTQEGDFIMVHSLEADNGDYVKKTVHVEMKGRFLFRADGLDILRPDSRLLVNDKTYVVDLGNNRDLWTAAAGLDGHTAIVTGTLDGDRITATAIKADQEFIRKTLKVEVSGRLYWNKNLLHRLVPEFQLASGREFFALDFDDTGLRKLAETLSGDDVIVTGTLTADVFSNDRIAVTSLKAANNHQIKETISVQLKGKLQYVITRWDTGEVLFTCDKMPNYVCKCWSIRYGVTADGKLYLLDLGDNKELQKEAEKLVSTNVTVQGTLQGDEVRVKNSFWLDFCGTTAKTFQW